MEINEYQPPELNEAAPFGQAQGTAFKLGTISLRELSEMADADHPQLLATVEAIVQKWRGQIGIWTQMQRD